MLPPLIPREVIFGNPERADAKISPDGTRMAFLAPDEGVLNVWVGAVGTDDYRPVTSDRDRGVRIYFWAHDGEHVLYLQDVGGDENWRLHKVHLDSGAVEDLTPFENVQVQVAAHDKRRPDELLLAMNREDARLHDIYRLDLASGRLEMVEKNPGNVMGWVADADHRVRAALAATADGGTELLVRDGPDGSWRSLLTWSPEDSLTSAPYGFTLDGESLYLVDSRNANTARLVRMQIATGELEVLAQDPEYDVSGVVVHPDTKEIQMVAFTRARTDWTALDPGVEADLREIAKLNPGDFQLVSRTHGDDVWVVAYTEDNHPVSYYVYDRKAKQASFLFYSRPLLAKYTLAHMEPISFQARDGLTMHGYLTRPPGMREPGPMVLNVHGGPWHRDEWGYDPESQWLANRGYACLQINFRGSTGYGKRFLNAGNREWGGRMHDDLVDAVQYAIERGYADRARIAIYGGSYGGYAALVGATFTPDLFCCAVDIVGPSNLITFIETIPPYWSTYLAMLHERVGEPARDAEFLKSRSPLYRVDDIKIPMLIAQGANDPRVKQSESEQIVAVMREKGIEHEYLLFEDEGHGFAKPENRLKFYAVAERFLARHLGGRYEDGQDETS